MISGTVKVTRKRRFLAGTESFSRDVARREGSNPHTTFPKKGTREKKGFYESRQRVTGKVQNSTVKHEFGRIRITMSDWYTGA